MELITPSIEIWKQGTSSPIEDMYAHIARCTRVCYQSEKKGNESEEDFVKRVILRHKPWNSEANHLAMLEHGSIYFIFDYTNEQEKYIVDLFRSNPYSKIVFVCKGNYPLPKEAHVTTNLRVLVENNLTAYLRYACAPTEHHAKRVTVSFTTNIGVSREFNRHRVNSIAEESTRYCNYNKRNDGQIKIGLPAWLLGEEHLPYIESHQFDSLVSYCDDICTEDDKNWSNIDYYLFALTTAEYCYNMLIKKGWTPQKAREVLPLATKTQLIHTAFVDDWVHFLNLRADGVSGPVHPNAKLLAAPLKELFIKQGIL